MHIISFRILREYAETHADCQEALSNWYKVVTKAKWSNLVEVQQVFTKAEAVGNFTVFNIKGNKYRLIVSIDYKGQLIYIIAVPDLVRYVVNATKLGKQDLGVPQLLRKRYKYILTHAEYNKENWKDDPYF